MLIRIKVGCMKKANVSAFVLLTAFLMLLSGCVTGAQFKGRSLLTDKEINLKGTIYKPAGEGPFPAVIVMSGCMGRNDLSAQWGQTLKGWGYVAFEIDSFGPRGGGHSCSGQGGGPGYSERALDAYYAKAYLNTLPYVKRDQVGIMGNSHGGGTTVTALNPEILEDLPKDAATPFKVGVAFYPWCFVDFSEVKYPLLVLTGKADEWHSENNCRENISNAKKMNCPITYKAFDGAHHLFDWIGMDSRSQFGHTLRYHPKAAEEATEMTKAFLAKYLK